MNLVAPTYYRCDSGVVKIVEPYWYPFVNVVGKSAVLCVPYTELKRTTKEEWENALAASI